MIIKQKFGRFFSFLEEKRAKKLESRKPDVAVAQVRKIGLGTDAKIATSPTPVLQPARPIWLAEAAD
jgi:hypothetical protein